jgi:hippurate hydrolase
MPGIPVGAFAIRPGPMMASGDRFTLTIRGKGGHAARPFECIDPIVVASHVVTALQSIVSRNVDPLESAVISVCTVKAGEAYNVIPQEACLLGTVRTLTNELRDLCETRIRALVDHVCAAFGAKATVQYVRGYPVTFNDEEKAKFMHSVACEVAGAAAVDTTIAPLMCAEDFSYMLAERPGAYILLGNGATAGVHHQSYDFNDEASPFGVSLWAKIIERGMPASA